MSDYLYAGARIKALENNLLTENQMEVLLSAKSYDEAIHNLHETFLGLYLAQNRDTPLPYILEMVVSDAKSLLKSIAPKPDLLNILWLKYDFYNLAAIVKGFQKGLEPEKIEALCFKSGIYKPINLIEAYKNKNLQRYNSLFKRSVDKAESVNEVSEVDRIMNMAYFESAKEIAVESEDQFLNDYVKLIIDFFNIQANLRALSHGTPGKSPRPIYVQGGTVPKTRLDDRDSLLRAIGRIGPANLWEDAIREYRETGSYALIETTFDNRIKTFIREKGNETFSIASLYSYFQAIKNNVQIVRTILVGKHSELPEHELRKTVRTRYG